MAPRQKTVFAIPKMDCAAEERLIRMALTGQDAVATGLPPTPCDE